MFFILCRALCLLTGAAFNTFVLFNMFMLCLMGLERATLVLLPMYYSLYSLFYSFFPLSVIAKLFSVTFLINISVYGIARKHPRNK